MKTFSLSTHSRLFSVPENHREYLFVNSGSFPYYGEPYRAESFAIVYIREGSVKLNAGLTTFDVVAPSIITLGPSVIRYFVKNNDHLKMDVIFFKDTFLQKQHADLFFLGHFSFFENSDQYVLPLSKQGVDKFNKLYELFSLTQASGGYHQTEIIRSYIFALVYEVDAYHHDTTAKISSPAKVKVHPLLSKFKKLLNLHYKQEHKLEFYANQLHLTAKSLSAAIKKQSGRSAGKWIDDAIILEAKVLLQNELLTVSQISDMLHFSDQSIFGKFFKAGTGMSPVQYRKRFG